MKIIKGLAAVYIAIGLLFAGYGWSIGLMSITEAWPVLILWPIFVFIFESLP